MNAVCWKSIGLGALVKQVSHSTDEGSLQPFATSEVQATASLLQSCLPGMMPWHSDWIESTPNKPVTS